MDRILNQVLDACGLAGELDRFLRNSGGAFDPGYLLASCQDAAGAFQRAAVSLRDFMLEPSAAAPAAGELAQLALEGGALPLRRGDVGSSSSSRKRKEGTMTLIVPATRTGNPDNPPDDGYTWRKYGQKDILNSRFPRSYYRCTHKSFYGCEAKKQVQRLNDDASVFKITYRGTHTCQTSPIPLLMPAANDDDIGGGAAAGDGSSAAAAAAGQVHDWTGSQGSLLGDGRQGAAPAQRGGRDTDGSVAELADAMFNSGSSSGNIDVIFPRRLN